MFLARLSRIIPFLLVLGIVALIIYFVAGSRHTNAHAKQTVINFFFITMGGLSIFFLLATLYGLIDSNTFAAELFGVFLITTLIGLGITAICNHIFLKHYPQYRNRAQSAKILTWWRKLLELLKQNRRK